MTKRTTSKIRRLLPALAALAFVFLLIFAVFVGYQLFFRERVILGVRLAGQSLTGLTRADAQSFLETKFGKPDAILTRVGGERITLRDRDKTWRAWPWELGLRTDFSPVADTAVAMGHRGSTLEMFAEQAQCLLFGCEISGDAQFDEGIAQSYLGWLASHVDQPPRDASVRIEGLRVISSSPAQNGRQLDGAAMLDKLRRRVLGSNRGEIELAFRETPTLITDIGDAKVQAETLLSGPALLSFNDHVWAIDQGALASMLTIQPKQEPGGKLRLSASLDHTQLVAYLKTLARDINQPARDARFHFDDKTDSLALIVPSQNGQTLDPEAAAKQIEQQIVASAGRVPGLASRSIRSARTMALPVNVTKPTIAAEDTQKFGIKELVSQGVSNFRGSAAGRVQNIRTTTQAMDGIVVPPGGTFSFDKYLPEVVEANGYDDAYIIFGDQTVLGPGGGVCQVSTTVFRAAFFGGFPIVERWAHAYRVGYYEPPVGLDATVFAPSVDLKFKNDTDSYLLIQPKLDLRTTTLTFDFYGTKPNRTVEMLDPIKENIIPHGPAIYTDDPTIKKGTTKQVDTEHDGMDVTIYRDIKVNGQLVKHERFFSRYQPWVARYQVGTKPVK